MTIQEIRDLQTLSNLGFDVINPSEDYIKKALEEIPQPDRMAWFERFADECDICVFRALPDGAIPCGVAKELAWFQQRNKPVIELPSAIQRRTITHEATKEYLREIGFR